MINIVIYANCAGNMIKTMFDIHDYTNNKFKVDYIVNYENLDKKLDISHISMLEKCNIFIYQPFNKDHSLSEYDVLNLTKYLPADCITLKMNYYRFKGFWYESECKPYNEYGKYKFLNEKYYGIHNSFMNFNGTEQEVIDKINNICIDNDKFYNYFNDELDNFKKIDDNSDIKMYTYFINNYKTKLLFHDVFHPTNLFFYEMFRQIILKISNYELMFEDIDFISKFNHMEMTSWALPMLPIIKKYLDIKLPDEIYVFYKHVTGDKKLCMSVYDYYYIRLSPNNFKNYLNKSVLIGKTYTWGTGFITFNDISTHTTPWGVGNYNWLSEYTIEVNWGKYSHIVVFNETFIEYYVIRKGDLIPGNGKLL